MKVCPTVSVTSLPSASKNLVGPVILFFRHVPLIVRPLVAIHALPLPMMSASWRFLCEPSLSGEKLTSMTITFFGATRLPLDASTCEPSTLTERRYVFALRL